MNAPQVTILITTYNYGRFVREAIDSVLEQDFPLDRVQILVVDDGSTDDTSERVRKYGPPVEYYRKLNGGQASALNFGLERARGEIVALLDADDLFMPGKLRRVIDAFQQDPGLGMVYHRLEEWHMETGQRRERDNFNPVSGDIQTAPEQFERYLAQPTSCISVRRSSLGPLLPVPKRIKMCADCFLVTLIPFLSPILAIPEFLGVYRVHGRNCYYTEEGRPVAANVAVSNARTWRLVIGAMSKWLSDNGYTRKQLPVRSLLNRWAEWLTFLDREEFAIAPPSRRRFFRHLLDCNRRQLHAMTWRLVIINYLDAFGALVVGHQRFPWWQKKREALVRRVRRMRDD